MWRTLVQVKLGEASLVEADCLDATVWCVTFPRPLPSTLCL